MRSLLVDFFPDLFSLKSFEDPTAYLTEPISDWTQCQLLFTAGANSACWKTFSCLCSSFEEASVLVQRQWKMARWEVALYFINDCCSHLANIQRPVVLFILGLFLEARIVSFPFFFPNVSVGIPAKKRARVNIFAVGFHSAWTTPPSVLSLSFFKSFSCDGYVILPQHRGVHFCFPFFFSRTLTELLKQPGEAGVVDGTGAHHPIGMGTNGISARALRSNNGQFPTAPPYIRRDHDGGLALVEGVIENTTRFSRVGG